MDGDQHVCGCMKDDPWRQEDAAGYPSRLLYVARHAAVAVGSQSRDQCWDELVEERHGKEVLCIGNEDRVS